MLVLLTNVRHVKRHQWCSGDPNEIGLRRTKKYSRKIQPAASQSRHFVPMIGLNEDTDVITSRPFCFLEFYDCSCFSLLYIDALDGFVISALKSKIRYVLEQFYHFWAGGSLPKPQI